ncbi:programmed cell death, putative [Ixodes scapularis]|uniref:Programmed cell death, putative n=1 Tax=Ixodes scapularis TaxID=6945 RepID=B7PMJ5_IXOSC|nr:programmed cell death, putative [Ixodes scapularis]|eukprot:XP_002434993.1 programmed cell death, putative [Ixodes scapularis]
MGDEELAAIRARRLGALQEEFGGNRPANVEREAEQKAKAEDFKNQVLSQALTQEARARLNTIAVAKPEKAALVENMLLRMVQMGQIQSKLQESDLINLLERVSEQTQKKTTVKVNLVPA